MGGENYLDELQQFTFDGMEFELTDRQKLFCMEYVRNKFNAGPAATAAGYSADPPVARNAGCFLLSVPDVNRYIEKLKNNLALAIGIDAIDIALEYAKVGFGNIKDVFDANGAMRKIKDLPPHVTAMIAAIEVTELVNDKGKVIGWNKKIKFHDKISALDKLAKMLGVDGVTKIQPVLRPEDEDTMRINENTVLRFRISGKDA